MVNWKENFEKIRRWIDGEQYDQIPVKIENVQQNKSESEIFLQKLLNSLEELLKKEITRIPNTNKAYIPERFFIHLSNEANKSLPDNKRKFFEQGLSSIILERAKEMAGKLELTSKKITVEIKINSILEGDDIEVFAFSEDKQKTIENIQSVSESNQIKLNETIVDAETVIDAGTILNILYSAEIWQAGKKLNEFSIINRKITIGRDDEEKLANLRLPTQNRKISREHAEIIFEPTGEIWVIAKHANPTIVAGQVIKNEERAKLDSSGEIQIYDFIIKLKFAK